MACCAKFVPIRYMFIHYKMYFKIKKHWKQRCNDWQAAMFENGFSKIVLKCFEQLTTEKDHNETLIASNGLAYDLFKLQLPHGPVKTLF